MAALISIQNLYFQYSKSQSQNPFSIQISSFSMADQEKWVVTGPSGSGKSTFLNLVAGELLPISGALNVLGEDLCAMSLDERQNFRIQNIGFVFQDFPLVPYLSAIENVLFPYFINPTISLNSEVRAYATHLLERVGLTQRIFAKPHQMSQGERQRVAIARALITKPVLILADEPTAGLDLERSHSVMELIDEIVEESNVGLLLVTHEPEIIERYSNRFLIHTGGLTQ